MSFATPPLTLQPRTSSPVVRPALGAGSPHAWPFAYELIGLPPGVQSFVYGTGRGWKVKLRLGPATFQDFDGDFSSADMALAAVQRWVDARQPAHT